MIVKRAVLTASACRICRAPPSKDALPLLDRARLGPSRRARCGTGPAAGHGAGPPGSEGQGTDPPGKPKEPARQEAEEQPHLNRVMPERTVSSERSSVFWSSSFS